MTADGQEVARCLQRPKGSKNGKLQATENGVRTPLMIQLNLPQLVKAVVKSLNSNSSNNCKVKTATHFYVLKGYKQ